MIDVNADFSWERDLPHDSDRSVRVIKSVLGPPCDENGERHESDDSGECGDSSHANVDDD